MSKTTRVAIYMRVSTTEQSTDMQRNEILEYVNARGFWAVHIYEDVASGSDTSKRPMWNQLMKDACSRRFDHVIVWRLDRWARSLKDLVVSIQQLADFGIKFVSIKDHIDLSVPSGQLMMHMIGAFADFEVQIIRERVRSGLAAAKSRGKRLGRPPTLDRDRIAKLRSSGMSLDSIAKQIGSTKSGVSKSLKKSAS